MEEGSKMENLSTRLFEDPDIGGVGDPEVMRVLNKQLEKDPLTTIPEGYKLKQTVKVQIEYHASILNDGYKVALQLLDEIIFTKFSTHILIPEIKIKNALKVKGQFIKPDVSNLAPLYKRIDYYDPNTLKSISKNKYVNRDKDEEFIIKKTQREMKEIKPKVGPILKLEIAKQPAGFQSVYQEVAEVCEELLMASERGLPRLPKRIHMAPGQIENNALRKRNQRMEEQKLQQELYEKKYQKMVKKVEQQNKQNNSEKERIQKEQKQIIQEQKLKQQQEKEKQEEVERQKRKERQKIREQWEQKKLGNQKQKEEMQNQKISDFKEKNKESLKRAKQRDKRAQNIQIERRQVIVKQKHKEMEQQGSIDQQFIEQHKKKQEHILEFGIKRKELEKAKLIEMKEVFKRSDIQNVLKDFRFQLKYMFEAMIKINTKKIEENISEALQQMQLVEWMKCCAYLNIIPILITRDDCLNIFRQLTIVKEFLPGTKPFVTFDEFQDGLVRIGIYAYDALKQFYGIEKPVGGFKNTKDIIDLHPEDFTGQMLSFLFDYLDLPKNKKRLEERFKQFQGNNYKTQHKSKVVSQMLYGNKNEQGEGQKDPNVNQGAVGSRTKG